MQKQHLLLIASVLMLILGIVILVLGVRAGLIPPMITGFGFIIIEIVFWKLKI